MQDQKIPLAGYIFQQMVPEEEFDSIENTRLMKYLYLVSFTYLLEANHFDNFTNTPFRDFEYTAYRNGPVEDDIYSYMPDIRAAIRANFDFSRVLKITPAQKAFLNSAIKKVQDTFASKGTSWLVDFTHSMLSEWARTPLFKVMTFSSGGYKTECRALKDYYDYGPN